MISKSPQGKKKALTGIKVRPKSFKLCVQLLLGQATMPKNDPFGSR